MPCRSLLFLTFFIFSFILHAAPENQGLNGTWISKGKMEIRTLVLNDNNKGEFISKHPQGTCIAKLKVTLDDQFVRASGLAPNCQQQNNAVAFEFYCQQLDNSRMRCKIRSIHAKSGSTKEGVEDFERNQI